MTKYFRPGEGTQTDAAPVQDNSDLSSSDSPEALQQDTDGAYMAQLESDINADLRAIDNY